MISMTEADICRKSVLPGLVAAGWDSEPHSFTEQRTFTDGRIIVAGGKIRRGKQKRADYLLRYPKDKTFTPFGDARHKIENGEVVKSREIYSECAVPQQEKKQRMAKRVKAINGNSPTAARQPGSLI